LLSDFAREIRERGFVVEEFAASADGSASGLGAGGVRESGGVSLIDGAQSCLRQAMREDADLVVIGCFQAFAQAAGTLKAEIGSGMMQGLPVLTTVSADRLGDWVEFAGRKGTMIPPDSEALWQWWGPEKLYQDLRLGVPEDEVRRVVCGSRWVMVEGPNGAGLAYLPQNPKELIKRLPTYRRASLRQLADLSQSWDVLEVAVGLAAINAHYNRPDMPAKAGWGVERFGHDGDRVVAVGALPAMTEALSQALVIKHEPAQGEYPLEAMESLVPGSAAVAIAAGNIANRRAPRIIRLAQGARVGIFGTGTPLSDRLFRYGVDALGGLVVDDAEGLARAVRDGASQSEFSRFCHSIHIVRKD
jgi:hypothetical protein